MLRFTPSQEQQLILDDISSGQNVVVDAVAGSGKTTTIFHIAKMCPTKKILVLTYNKDLKFEGRTRAQLNDIKNVDIHTYHSAAGTYYDISGSSYADSMKRIINGDLKPRRALNHDIVVLDEVQDMTQELYIFSRKVLRDQIGSHQLLILGDTYQCIYRFRGADPRFLTHAADVFSTYEFSYRTLSTSYRITHQMATFVNYMIGFERIKAAKSGSRVTYHTGGQYRCVHRIFKWLMEMFKTGVKPEDVFILAFSVKRRSREKPVHKLENLLSEAGIPIYRPQSDESELDSTMIRGKTVISSFHQSKGRERKICICYGLEADYFKWSNQTRDINNGFTNPNICPNEWYVAATRGIENLIIVGDATLPPWIRGPPKPSMGSHISRIGPIPRSSTYGKEEEPNETSVTELVSHLPPESEYEISPLLDEIMTSDPKSGSEVCIDSVIDGKDKSTKEEVSDITGIAVAALYENSITGMDPFISEHLKSALSKTGEPLHRLPGLPTVISTPSHYLQLANLWESHKSGYNNRLNQITSYDWLDEEQTNGCLDNIQVHISDEDVQRFEGELRGVFISPFGEIFISGAIDCVCSDDMWEFKCVSELKTEHLLQLLVYEYLAEGSPKTFHIMNIRTGDAVHSSGNKALLSKIMEKLIEYKYKPPHIMSMSQFLEMCSETKLSAPRIKKFTPSTPFGPVDDEFDSSELDGDLLL